MFTHPSSAEFSFLVAPGVNQHGVGDPNDVYSDSITLAHGPSYSFHYTLDNTFNVNANTIYEITMYLNIDLDLSAETPSTIDKGYFFGASGAVDPLITLSGPDASSYTLLLSPGIGDSPTSVPEPSTWDMMLLGFAGLGYAGYRASRKSAALAA